MNRIVLPGATIGVLGSGQLGRMLALAARRMGYRVHTLSPGVDTPTGQVADRPAITTREARRDVDSFDVIEAEVVQRAKSVAATAEEFDDLHVTRPVARAEFHEPLLKFVYLLLRRFKAQVSLFPRVRCGCSGFDRQV